MASAKFNDDDQLNISGDWDIFYRNNIDPNFTFPPGHARTLSLKFLDLFSQHRNCFKQISDDAVVGYVKDWGFRVLFDGYYCS